MAVAVQRSQVGSGLVQAQSLVVVAAGSRHLDWSVEAVALSLLVSSSPRLVHAVFHGAARGADALVDRAARRLGLSVRAVPAHWSRYGRSAGPRRNELMLQQAHDLAAARSTALHAVGVMVLLFPGGVGTASLRRLACRRAGVVPVELVCVSLASATASASTAESSAPGTSSLRPWQGLRELATQGAARPSEIQ